MRRFTEVHEGTAAEVAHRSVQHSGEGVLVGTNVDAPTRPGARVPDEPVAGISDADVILEHPVLRDDGAQHRLQSDLRKIPPFCLGNGGCMFVEVPDRDWRTGSVEPCEMTLQFLPDDAPAVPARQNVNAMGLCLCIDQLVVAVAVPERFFGKRGDYQAIM